MNILQKIFKDNYEVIQYTLHPRAVEMENIEKMINCGAPSFGGTMYACSQCGKMKFVPFRCKSRFCPTCGVKYCQERSTSMSFKLLRCNHRHCVFTIDEELRHFFLEDRPSWTAFSRLSAVSYHTCSIRSTCPKTLFLALSVSSIPSDGPWNGTLISTASSRGRLL